MLSQPPFYRAFLLRMWKERSLLENKPARWRFSLEETRTSERRGFADIERLIAFLKTRMEEDDPTRG